MRTTLSNIGAELVAPIAVYPADFGVEVSFDGQWTVASVRGDLDVVTAPTLRSIVDGVVNAGHLLVCLDLEAVTLISAAGVAVIAAAKARLDRIGSLVLESVPSHASRVLEICGFSELLTLAADGAGPRRPAGRVHRPATASRLASCVPPNRKREATWASS
jgi:anti-anti-sigma factor